MLRLSREFEEKYPSVLKKGKLMSAIGLYVAKGCEIIYCQHGESPKLRRGKIIGYVQDKYESFYQVKPFQNLERKPHAGEDGNDPFDETVPISTMAIGSCKEVEEDDYDENLPQSSLDLSVFTATPGAFIWVEDEEEVKETATTEEKEGIFAVDDEGSEYEESA